MFDKIEDTGLGPYQMAHFICPVKLFPVPTKNGKGNQDNERHILTFLEEIFGGKHIDSMSIQADGAIIKQGLIDSLSKKHAHLKCSMFLCMSHVTFLAINHAHYYDMNDVGIKASNFFPNHTPTSGKEIFFFGDENAKKLQCENFQYFLDILNNLSTQSVQKIELRHHIFELQKMILKQRVEEKMANDNSSADDENLIMELTSSDYMAYQRKRFFGQSKLTNNPVKIPVSPGKKSRRFVEMTASFCKAWNVADYVAKTHFSKEIPNYLEDGFSTKFIQDLSELTALQQYCISLADSSSFGNNITLLRLLAIVSKAAFCLDGQETSEYSVLDNPMIG